MFFNVCKYLFLLYFVKPNIFLPSPSGPLALNLSDRFVAPQFFMMPLPSDTADDELKYDDIELQTFSGKAGVEEVVGYLEPKPTRKNVERKSMTWTTEPPKLSGQLRKGDIIDTGRKRYRLPGTPHAAGKKVESIGDAYDLQFTQDMYEFRVRMSNGKIQAIRDLVDPIDLARDKYRHLKLTTVTGNFFLRKFCFKIIPPPFFTVIFVTPSFLDFTPYVLFTIFLVQQIKLFL